MELFHDLFYRPMFNALIGAYHYLPVHDLGLAIVAVTIMTLAILYWPSLIQIRSSQMLQELQPKLKALQEKHKGNREELARQTMALYRQHKFNPLSSCLPIIVQFPFFIALYQVFISGLKIDPASRILAPERLADLYGSLRDTYAATPITTVSFGFLDLSATKNIVLALLVGISQYFLTRLLAPRSTPPNVPGAKDERSMTTIMRQMNHITPFTFAFISYILPAGLSLYYITWNIFQIIQRRLLTRRPKPPAEPVQP
ncbi:MAG: membrane protein insertase YidC [Candidatus Kerfeldbacteria bacterium]|nr:membrane protein insertase YidC [Candidatus Kerfeldbacteria bacterium]